MNLNNPIYELSIEPIEGQSFMHGFHLGTDLALAKKIAVEVYEARNRSLRERDHRGNIMKTKTVAIMLKGKLVDCYCGDFWSLEYDFWNNYDEEPGISYLDSGRERWQAD